MQSPSEEQSGVMEEGQTICILSAEQLEISNDAEDITEKLFLLTFELADPEQELSVQHPGEGATTFTCFPNLPIEVRLMIWRASFPKGRKVVLEVQWRRGEYHGSPVPVTLAINQESRRESRRHYFIYFQTAEVLDDVKLSYGYNDCLICLSKLPLKPKPLVFNPSKDCLTMYCHDFVEPWAQTLCKIVAERSQHLGRIEAVNIDGNILDYYPYISAQEIWGFLNFHNLKEIRYISRGMEVLGTECKEMLRKFFNDGFELERRNFPACEKPKVLFFNNWAQLMDKPNR